MDIVQTTGPLDGQGVVVSLRLGSRLVGRIDDAANATQRSRAGWMRHALTIALTRGLPSGWLSDLDFLDVIADRRPVAARLPADLISIIDRRARRAGVTRTAVLTALFLRALADPMISEI